MLKKEIEIVKKSGLNYIVQNGKLKKYTSWAGDIFACNYDEIMKNRVFPKLFNASIVEHNRTLKSIYKDYQWMDILEIGTGSGNASMLLNKDNYYAGVDISHRLIREADTAFSRADFENYDLYLCSADELPFKKNSFDVCICNLSLNFFPKPDKALAEVHRVLMPNGKFICSVPLSDRIYNGRRMRGTHFTQKRLKEIMHMNGFTYSFLSDDNGALIYFEGSNLKGA